MPGRRNGFLKSFPHHLSPNLPISLFKWFLSGSAHKNRQLSKKIGNFLFDSQYLQINKNRNSLSILVDYKTQKKFSIWQAICFYIYGVKKILLRSLIREIVGSDALIPSETVEKPWK